MLIFVARHGQPVFREGTPIANPEFPPGDPPLSELGRQQAEYLGLRLKQTGFTGRILSSPYRRTLETAQVAAEVTGARIWTEQALQEYVQCDGPPGLSGLNLEQIVTMYPAVDRSSVLPYPWFFHGPEDGEKVKERVRPLTDRFTREQQEDVLLIGHGASTGACRDLFIPDVDRNTLGAGWNCALSTYEVDEHGNVISWEYADISHIPPRHVTSNSTYMLPQQDKVPGTGS